METIALSIDFDGIECLTCSEQVMLTFHAFMAGCRHQMWQKEMHANVRPHQMASGMPQMSERMRYVHSFVSAKSCNVIVMFYLKKLCKCSSNISTFFSSKLSKKEHEKRTYPIAVDPDLVVAVRARLGLGDDVLEDEAEVVVHVRRVAILEVDADWSRLLLRGIRFFLKCNEMLDLQSWSPRP